MKFEEWFKEKYGQGLHPEKTLNDLWTDADILIAMLNKEERKTIDREEWLNRKEAVLSAWDIK